MMAGSNNWTYSFILNSINITDDIIIIINKFYFQFLTILQPGFIPHLRVIIYSVYLWFFFCYLFWMLFFQLHWAVLLSAIFFFISYWLGLPGILMCPSFFIIPSAPTITGTSPQFLFPGLFIYIFHFILWLICYLLALTYQLEGLFVCLFVCLLLLFIYLLAKGHKKQKKTNPTLLFYFFFIFS